MASRPAAWYIEQAGEQIALAAFAWKATQNHMAREKYSGQSTMTTWLGTVLGNTEIVWLDEVFADTNVRKKGNLQNFGAMCRGFMELLQSDTVAFRTINAKMVAATMRDFKTESQVFRANKGVPDRRDFVIIRSQR